MAKVHGCFQGYVVYYTSGNWSLPSWESVPVDGGETKVEISGLQENTDYSVRMRAVGPDGNGMISDVYLVQTKRKSKLRMF